MLNAAAEHVQAEAKIREVETELSIVQASSSLMAAGDLDYSLNQDATNEDDNSDREGSAHSRRR